VSKGKSHVVALAGNPNAGKSSIFNALTGSRQHVGNWPGKTVERKEGEFACCGMDIRLVDLPGTYSLAAYSPEEVIARDFIVNGGVDAVVNVTDATNLERNLYLTVQVLETGVPTVLVLNMADALAKEGIRIDDDALSQLLGNIPVLRTVASKGVGLEELKKTIYRQLVEPAPAEHHFSVDYGRDVEREIASLEEIVRQNPELAGSNPRWLAIKLLEGEADIVRRVASKLGENGALMAQVQKSQGRLRSLFHDDPDIIMADRRYGCVHGIALQVWRRRSHNRLTFSDQLDRVVAHRLLGLPIFFIALYILFELVVNVSAPYLDWMSSLFAGPFTRWILLVLNALHAPAWMTSLMIDGVLAGVGGVLSFVPGLAVLYFFLALLEDSGYMARAAFVMDKFMSFLGLHGKSFIPMILGFGCNVPAVYATRTLENRRDRLLTALLIPFMSCSARLPVYVIFALAFFAAQAGTVIWGLYALGVLMAVVTSFLFNRLLFNKVEKSAFLLELPPYRLPTARSLWLHTWEHLGEFIRRAGTVIALVSVILWFMLNLPLGVQNTRDSWFGEASAGIAVVLKPLGFGDWQAAGALTSGFIAKEVVVSTMSQVYAGEGNDHQYAELLKQGWRDDLDTIVIGFGRATIESGKRLLELVPGVHLERNANENATDTPLQIALQGAFTPAAALAFLVFVLLYVPCVATLSAIRQEFGSRWMLFSTGYQMTVAWIMAFITYHVAVFWH